MQKAREYSASRRGEDVKGEWQEYERKQKQQHRAQETTEQRESRLQRMRDYSAVRKDWDKKRMKEARANETAEQREARLQKMRDNSAARRATKAERAKEAAVYPEIPRVGSAKEREKTRKRVAAIRANRTAEQVEHDREVSRKGMAKLKERRMLCTDGEKAREYIATTARRAARDHQSNCRVRKYRLAVAKGEDPGPEELNPNGKPINCHTCDQDLDLPLAGKGRCPCYDCAVLFDKVYEYDQRQMKMYPKLRGSSHMPEYDPNFCSGESGSESPDD